MKMKDGFINVLKPPGMTSHDVVGYVRRLLNLKKVGHAGTLDPGAAGVLPVAVGRATRLIEYIADVDKSYRAELLFGTATDSGDDLGAALDTVTDFVMPSASELTSVFQELTGDIIQVPPAYSAIKINGRRACDLARQNIDVKIPERRITIYSLDLLERREKTILFDVNCSKGTYIRTLCADIGKKLGIPATMSFLLRTRVGGFSLASACTLEELAELGEAAVIAPEECLGDIPRFELWEKRAQAFANGLSTRLTDYDGAPLVAVFSAGVFYGIGRYDQETSSLVPVKVYMTNN